MKRKYSVTIVYLLITVCIFLIVYFLFPSIVNQVKDFYSKVPQLMEQIKQNDVFGRWVERIDFANMITLAVDDLGAPIFNAISKIANGLMVTGIGLGAAFFVSLDFQNIKQYIMTMPSNKYRSLFKRIVSHSGVVIFKYIKGMLLDTVILFTLAAIAFFLLKFEYFYVYAILISITNLIPFIGAWLGGIPIAIIAMATSFQLATIVVVVVMILQYIESNFVQPIILKEVIKLHPLVEVMALIFFGGIFGVIGMIASPMLAVIIKYIYTELTDGAIPNDE